MPTLQISDASMVLLVKEARRIDATIKAVADALISEAFENVEDLEELEEPEEED